MKSGNTGMDLNNNQQPIFTLCGVIVDENDWYELNHYIQESKKDISPELISAEIHASDIFNSSKNLKKGYNYRKNTYQENLKILEKIVDLIVSLKFTIFCVNIRKDEYLKKCKEKFHIINKDDFIEPYIFSFMCMMKYYNNYLITNNCNGMIFKDEIGTVDTVIEELYDIIFSDNSDINNIIENALSLDSKRSTFIQIADICNFYINKYHAIKLYDKVKNQYKKNHCLKQYEKLKPFIHYIDY